MRVRIFKREDGTRDYVVDKLRTRDPVPAVAVTGQKREAREAVNTLIREAGALQKSGASAPD